MPPRCAGLPGHDPDEYQAAWPSPVSALSLGKSGDDHLGVMADEYDGQNVFKYIYLLRNKPSHNPEAVLRWKDHHKSGLTIAFSLHL